MTWDKSDLEVQRAIMEAENNADLTQSQITSLLDKIKAKGKAIVEAEKK